MSVNVCVHTNVNIHGVCVYKCVCMHAPVCVCTSMWECEHVSVFLSVCTVFGVRLALVLDEKIPN